MMPVAPTVLAAPLLSKVTVKASPSARVDGVASATFAADSMVTSTVLRLPIGWLSISAFVNVTARKSDSGSTSSLTRRRFDEKSDIHRVTR